MSTKSKSKAAAANRHRRRSRPRFQRPSGPYKAINARLAKLMGQETYAEIGRRTGHHPENIRRYMEGLSKPPVDFVAAVAEEYGISLDWLVMGKGKQSGVAGS